jgi:hypothetical protein
MGKVRQVYQKDPWMTGKIKSVADKGSRVTRPGRTDRVYGILALASARLHLHLGSYQESAAWTADTTAMRSNFFGKFARPATGWLDLDLPLPAESRLIWSDLIDEPYPRKAGIKAKIRTRCLVTSKAPVHSYQNQRREGQIDGPFGCLGGGPPRNFASAVRRGARHRDHALPGVRRGEHLGDRLDAMCFSWHNRRYLSWAVLAHQASAHGIRLDWRIARLHMVRLEQLRYD